MITAQKISTFPVLVRAAAGRASFALMVLIGSDSGMVSISHRKWGDRHSEILRCSFSS
jgi:hypothetical protein